MMMSLQYDIMCPDIMASTLFYAMISLQYSSCYDITMLLYYDMMPLYYVSLFVEVDFLWSRTVDSLKTSFHPLLRNSSGLRDS